MSNPLGEHGIVINQNLPPLDIAHLVHISVMTVFGFVIGYLVKKAME